MALHSTDTPLRLAEGAAFEEPWKPGEKAPIAGLWRCRCGQEWPLRVAERFPGADQHGHQASQGEIVWRLILACEDAVVVRIPARARLVDAPPRANAVRVREDLGA